MNDNQKCLSIIILIASTSSFASWSGDHKHRSHEAHVHGEAKLTLALEGNTLEISLESPAVNIVGFEHKASTAEQNHVVEQAEAVLKSTQQLFTFSGTRCDVKKIMVDVSSVENSGIDHHDHHKDEHEHERAHNDDHKHSADQHDAHHDKDHGHDNSHSEITADYSFTCAQGEKLRFITVDLLDQFPGIEEMDAMWVTDARQGAVELNAGAKHINLR